MEKKILISGNFKKGSNDFSYARSFQKQGYDVVFFNDQELYDARLASMCPKFFRRFFHRFFWPLVARKVNTDFVKKALDVRPDVLFVIKGWFYSPSSIRFVKTKLSNTIIVCLNPDNPFNTWHHGTSNKWVRSSIPLYDIYFIWGKFLIDPLRKAGALHPVYIPFAYDPEFRYPVSLNDSDMKRYGSDVAFIGTYDEEREYWLGFLKDYDLKIWGNSWEKSSDRDLKKKWQHVDAVGDDFAKVCAAATININIIRKQNIPAHNMRTFDVPACKGFLLSLRTDEATDFFVENEEMGFFSTPQELREKIDYYLSNVILTKQMAQRAFEKVQRYTFDDRIISIIHEITLYENERRNSTSK